MWISPTTDNTWNLVKQEEGISVYTKYIEGFDIKAVKVVSIFNCSLTDIIAVFKDVENYPTWVYGCKQASMLKQLNEKEGIYYSVSDAPWPVSDRDVVMFNTTSQNPESKIVTSVSQAKQGEVPEKEDIVRMMQVKSKWILKPIGNGSVEVTYEIAVNPAGYIPAWLVNLTIDIGPVQTIMALKKRISLPQYKGKSYSHISNY